MTTATRPLADLPERLVAIVILFVAAGSLRLIWDHYATLPGLDRPGPRAWFLAGYLTILTGLLVAAAMTAIALKWRIRGWQAASLVISTLMVGSIYHLFLARALHPQGLHWWGTQGLHTALPLLTLLWWWAFAPKDIRPGQAPLFIAWPVLYTGYALLRGGLTGLWPYPFMDVAALGLPRVLANLIGIGLAFGTLGLGLAALARRLR